MSLALARQLFLCLIFKKKKEILEQMHMKIYVNYHPFTPQGAGR